MNLDFGRFWPYTLAAMLMTIRVFSDCKTLQMEAVSYSETLENIYSFDTA